MLNFASTWGFSTSVLSEDSGLSVMYFSSRKEENPPSISPCPSKRAFLCLKLKSLSRKAVRVKVPRLKEEKVEATNLQFLEFPENHSKVRIE